MESYIAALLAAIAFGTIWGWLLLILFFIGVTACVENDEGFLAFATLLLGVFILDSTHLKSAGLYLVSHPWNVLMVIVLYFVAGTVWGVVKWFLYVTRQLEKYNECRRQFLSERKITELTPEMKNDFERFSGCYGIPVVPQVHTHKSDILMWMTYWPFSSVWTLINDPVRRIFRAIYNSIASSLQAVSDRVFRGVTEELNKKR